LSERRAGQPAFLSSSFVQTTQGQILPVHHPSRRRSVRLVRLDRPQITNTRRDRSHVRRPSDNQRTDGTIAVRPRIPSPASAENIPISRIRRASCSPPLRCFCDTSPRNSKRRHSELLQGRFECIERPFSPQPMAVRRQLSSMEAFPFFFARPGAHPRRADRKPIRAAAGSPCAATLASGPCRPHQSTLSFRPSPCPSSGVRSARCLGPAAPPACGTAAHWLEGGACPPVLRTAHTQARHLDGHGTAHCTPAFLLGVGLGCHRAFRISWSDGGLPPLLRTEAVRGPACSAVQVAPHLLVVHGWPLSTVHGCPPPLQTSPSPPPTTHHQPPPTNHHPSLPPSLPPFIASSPPPSASWAVDGRD